jgi:ppGpp synthetase/RelA/SpoT-type nucleotidyltranferase
MPLPMTKRDFDRLGDRLIAHESPSDTDLADLEPALAVYQEVLDRVKVHLRDLGFAATARVKTTTTMTDKLRRTPGMDLSRVQDIAGARITVRNLAAQDQAKDQISEFYTAQGCRVREIDRREDPRFGYRAMHLVVHVDGLPIEIQIRTELQDSWAQIVERLGDRWGRGIRYGQDPENPEGLVRSGGDVFTRRELLEVLMRLSDAILRVERDRRWLDASNQVLGEMDSLWEQLQSGAWPELLVSKIPPGLVASAEDIATTLEAQLEELDEDVREFLAIPATDLTNAQLRRMLEAHIASLKREHEVIYADVAPAEEQLRDILQWIADATDEGA